MLQHYGHNVVILAMDQLKLYFQASLTRVWFPRGQTPVVKVTPQRDHAHFYGALEVCSGREVAVTAPEQTSQVTADFIRLLLMLCPHRYVLAERFIRTLKEEHIDYSEYTDFEDAFAQLEHWLEVEYMTERIHSALGYLTPTEFEARLGISQPNPLLLQA